MGCGDTCPVFPGKRYLDWQLEDPAGFVNRLNGLMLSLLGQERGS